MAGGSMKMGVPNIGMGVVDVRDVAEAHYQAATRPEANGRYITCAHNSSFLEIGQVLYKRYGKEYPLPNRPLPKWLLMLVGPMVNKQLNRKYIRNNVDIPFKADNSKIRKELDMTFIPLEQTLQDTFDLMINEKMVKPG